MFHVFETLEFYYKTPTNTKYQGFAKSGSRACCILEKKNIWENLMQV